MTKTLTKIGLASAAFEDGQPIPKRHSAEWQNLSPPLSWSDVPAEAKELVLIVEDPDAPGGTFPHWLMYNIPPTTSSLPEGVPAATQLTDPPGAMQGMNGFSKIGYGGPMPPRGHGPHHYHFRLFALDQAIEFKPGGYKEDIYKDVCAHAIAQGELVGIYERK